MTEKDQKNLELYRMKFEASPALFNEFQASDYIKVLKEEKLYDELFSVAKTFQEEVPELKTYVNQYGYALYNMYVNVDGDVIKENTDLYYETVKTILDMTKPERYSPYNATLSKALRYETSSKVINYEKVLELLAYQDATTLSDVPFKTPDGREVESQKERNFRFKVRALYETKNYEGCIEAANIALASSLTWHYNAQNWIAYYRALSLVEVEQYEEAKRAFLALNNRIRGVDFYDVLYKVYHKNNNHKEANIYLLYNFFESGYDISLLPLYKSVLEAAIITTNEDIINAVDTFIVALCQENNKEYTPITPIETTVSSSDLYDVMYNKIMSNLGLFVDRVDSKVVYYNEDRKIGTIADRREDDGYFFRQDDFVYDDDVQRGDEVQFTLLPTYDNKKQTVSMRAILIVTTQEYVSFDY